MKKVTKILKGAGVAALVMGLVPFRYNSDKETGDFEVGALLWSLKKTSGDGQDQYKFELFPGIGSNKKPAEEPAAEEAIEEVVAESTESEE